jgi:hypothetical protein
VSCTRLSYVATPASCLPSLSALAMWSKQSRRHSRRSWLRIGFASCDAHGKDLRGLNKARSLPENAGGSKQIEPRFWLRWQGYVGAYGGVGGGRGPVRVEPPGQEAGWSRASDAQPRVITSRRQRPRRPGWVLDAVREVMADQVGPMRVTHVHAAVEGLLGGRCRGTRSAGYLPPMPAAPLRCSFELRGAGTCRRRPSRTSLLPRRPNNQVDRERISATINAPHEGDVKLP